MADQLHIHAQLVKQVLEEEHLGRKAYHGVHSALACRHIHLVCGTCKVIAGVGRVFYERNDCLAALTEFQYCPAQFLNVSYSGRHSVRSHIQEFHTRICCCDIQSLDGIKQAKGLDGHIALHKNCHIHRIFLFGNHEIGHIHIENSLLRHHRSV